MAGFSPARTPASSLLITIPSTIIIQPTAHASTPLERRPKPCPTQPTPASFSADDASRKPKIYVLANFPTLPAAGLHIGHAFTFTGADVSARFQRMQGKNVLFPMGWDAFGLPTENYAIRNGANRRM